MKKKEKALVKWGRMAWIVAGCLVLGVLPANAAGLNDTGQTTCYYGDENIAYGGNVVSCATAVDDGRYGRDAAVAAGALTPSSSGTKGFDFTKIANNGTTLTADAVPGATANDWACTKDNVTGLTWEVKTIDGSLRDSAHTYTWYSADNTSNGNNVGSLGANTCGGTLSAYSNQCNTANYVAAINAAKLCNYTDWRMPSFKELQSLIDFSYVAVATIDATYFPNTQYSWFWTANNYASDPSSAWYVAFNYGYSFADLKTILYYVRLVRGGQ